MKDKRSGVAAQNRIERAFEALGEGERNSYDLVFDPATGELRAVGLGDDEDEDRIPATQMAREGFFWDWGGGKPIDLRFDGAARPKTSVPPAIAERSSGLDMHREGTELSASHAHIGHGRKVIPIWWSGCG